MLLLKKKTFVVESTGTRVAADEAAVVARAEDVVSAAEASACGSVDDEVAVAYLEHVGCCTSAGAFCS